MRTVASTPPISDSTGRAAGFGAVLIALFGIMANAQPIPKINSASSEWLQRGTTAEVTFAGQDLADATRLIVSGGTGVSASLVSARASEIKVESSSGGISAVDLRDAKSLRVKITVAGDASLGEREVRVAGPTGVSNPISLHVGNLPELVEKGANHSAKQAQTIELPAALTGKIGAPAEIDYFRFTGKKGQKLIVDVYASRLGSPLDSSLAILDNSGKELARSEDVNGLDSLLAFTIPDDGDYVLQLRDFRYQGGGAFRYRFVAGAVPYVYSVFPFGGRRGQNVAVEVRGHNFDGPRLMLHVDANAPLGHQDLRAQTSTGISNPFPFDVTDLPEFSESEPNSDFAQANAVTLPVVINGRINDEKDRDTFKFKVGKNQSYIFEILATRFGSPLDALLTLTDAKGNVLQRNDDAVGADARLERRFAEAGEYAISVRDLIDRGGESFGYRLSIRPPKADFAVQFIPDNPRIHRGGHVPVRCELTRLIGFNETVRITFSDLPPGLFCEPLILTPNGPASGWLMLSASDDCPLGQIPLKGSATTVLGGKPVTRALTALANDKPVKEAFLTVLDKPPFDIDLATLSASADQEETATVEVLAQRRNGFAGEIKVSAEGFSAGRDPITKSLDVPQLVLKGAESQATLKLKARMDSEVGTRPIVIKAESTVSGQAVTQYSAPLPLTVHEIPFVLSTTLKRLSVAALPSSSESAAREAVFSVKAGRRAGFNGEIQLLLDGLPEGIAATFDKIPADSSETTVKLVASEKAPAGKEFTLRIHGTGQFNDRTYRQSPPEIKLAVTAPEPAAPLANVGSK